ncbi:MAG: DUF167 domain-containing protein [Acidobacteriaceae bacterium]|nr:DUF167 domain-containing protein [Acidobacteriaceae bacterium]
MSSAESCTLALRIQPGAKRTAVLGLYGEETIRIALNAPPVDGKANEALIRFLAETLALTRSAVEILSGQTARTKLVRLTGVSLTAVRDRLLANSR